jgi:hypothetical protein
LFFTGFNQAPKVRTGKAFGKGLMGGKNGTLLALTVAPDTVVSFSNSNSYDHTFLL